MISRRSQSPKESDKHQISPMRGVADASWNFLPLCPAISLPVRFEIERVAIPAHGRHARTLIPI